MGKHRLNNLCLLHKGNRRTFYAGNASQKFRNTADFTADGIAKQSASSDPTGNSEVLAKSGSYNYDTHEITWTVRVNKNSYPLTNCVFTDELADYLTYVPDSATVKNNSTGKDVTSSFPMESTGNTLLCDFGNLSDSLTLTFRTKLDVTADDLPDDFSFLTGNYNKSDDSSALTITNVAKLDTNENHGVAAPGTCKIKNSAFNKTASVNQNDYTVSYSIAINQAGIDMTPLRTEDGFVVFDSMSSDLVLDPDSVELKRARIASDGSFKAINGALPIDGVTVSNDNNKISITLPLGSEQAPVDGSYLLTYNAFVNVAKKGNFYLTNSASFGALGTALDSNNETQFYSAYSDAFATRIPGRAGLQIKKVAANDPNLPIKDAVYNLYKDPECKEFVQSSTTDENGIASFAALHQFTTFYLLEKTAPAGYAVDKQIHAVTTGAAQKEPVLITLTDSRFITFTKVDENGNPLKGAEFALYKKDDVLRGETAVATATSDANGTVTFTGEGIAPGSDYQFIETTAPDGYIKSDLVYFVSLDSDGNQLEITYVTDTDGILENIPVTSVANVKKPPVTPQAPSKKQPVTTPIKGALPKQSAGLQDDKEANPKTNGDTDHLPLFAGLGLLALIGAAITLITSKRKALRLNNK